MYSSLLSVGIYICVHLSIYVQQLSLEMYICIYSKTHINSGYLHMMTMIMDVHFHVDVYMDTETCSCIFVMLLC